MSDDILVQLSSNSSNTSNPGSTNRLAKLEARMVTKDSSSSLPSTLAIAAPMVKFDIAAQNLVPPPSPASPTSDSDDDDNGEKFLIQANTRKRQKIENDDRSIVSEHVEASTSKLILETVEVKADADVNKGKYVRGRGQSIPGRGRGSRVNNHPRIESPSPSNSTNGQFEDSDHKGNRPQELYQNKDHSSLVEEVASLRIKVSVLEEDLRKSHQETSDFKNMCQQLEKELKDFKDNEELMKPKRMKIISDLLISVSKAERQESRMKVRQDSLRLGNVGVIRAGTIISETWEDGQALKDLNSHLRHLLETKEVVERQRKSQKKRQLDKGDPVVTENGGQEEDLLIQDEIIKSRLASIKREEESCLRERDRYELEKGRLIREMKRIRDEDSSRFNNFQILNHRYAILNLLGKGGFSEVYKAYDLLEHRYVACKLHGLNAQWSEEKKQSYIRHAIREYNIHKTLVHHHIVRLWDIFEIDQNTFCTVLEYCSGKDLDGVLKATPVLPEREARIIIVQIFQGLVYLNKRTHKVIHYDLKPGNVLFDDLGVAKVTDFGLSKIVEDDVGSQGMELTSQGAGTYWYLPPECFELSKTPLISSKVDVWSAGILFYQMLFGKRPFGHDQSQERILREGTIMNARKVEFPTRPSVSNEAKDMIRRCLMYNQAGRPDILTIAQDPYLTYLKK